MSKKILFFFFILPLFSCSQPGLNDVESNYTKTDTLITMRDGVRLYTVIYRPKDGSVKYPILMQRTPYSAGPYGAGNYKASVGPNAALMKEKYIFVYQDVRGRYMSEGVNKEVTPYIANKQTDKDVDESSDTYDTVDWLIQNVPGNNGRVGLYGISYPGFYATASLPGAHPAIKAVSPQAPVTDEFIGDDANHNGAFFLLDNFFFMNYFGKERPGPVEDYGGGLFPLHTNDVYGFFLKMGSLKNTQSPKYFNNRFYIWNEYLEHDTYDEYWQSRNIRQYLNDIQIPTLTVGGWFDAEDLFGALNTFKAIDEQGGQNNYLVMGPWTHGGWARDNWNSFGSYHFQSNTSGYFQDTIQTRFFNYYLKDKGDFNLKKATVFHTGKNEWLQFDAWPPANTKSVSYYLQNDFKLSTALSKSSGKDSYISDPANPVPYTRKKSGSRNNEYMIEDQSFLLDRKDVLSYTSPVLENDLTVGGPLSADLYVSMSGTDVDFVVKLIEVIPLPSTDVAREFDKNPDGYYCRLVRAEIMRGKFRNNYVTPEPFEPGKPTKVHINLNDIMHTFKKGHQIMVQIQSSWFPLVDRNPNKFMRIPDADEKDFQKNDINIYHGGDTPSGITLQVMEN